MSTELPSIVESRRLRSPAVTPQALAWQNGALWIGSRDLRRVYVMDAASWTVREEIAAPDIPWAAVSTGTGLRFTIGEGADDDRYLRSYEAGAGFDSGERVPCPEFTGSYLSYDGKDLYLSQWYKHRLLKLDQSGEVLRVIEVGAEICGHVFVGDFIYVLRGTEEDGEHWQIARLDPRQPTPDVQDIAVVPFQCRSLTHDGEQFWTNHRAADETVAFSLPH